MAGRRGNNEGGVTQRKDGRWQVQVLMPDGKRRSAYGKTRREAMKKLEDLKAEAERAGRLNPTSLYRTMGDLFAAFLVLKSQKAANTYADYRDTLRRYCSELVSLPPAKLTAQHLQKLLAKRMAEGLSAATAQHVYRTLHIVCAFGYRQGVFDHNLMDHVDPIPKHRYDYRTLTASQVRILLNHLASHRLYALFVLAVSTGMRQGELLGLHWRDVDLNAGTIQVQHNLQRVDGVLHMKGIKTESGRRRILLTALARDALREHQQRQEIEAVALKWDDADLVFRSIHGTPLNRHYVTDMIFTPALKQAGLPHIRFYDLRHTAATLLMEAGVHPKVVSEILGHSNIAITLGTYSHVLPPMHAAAMETMNTLLALPETATPATIDTTIEALLDDADVAQSSVWTRLYAAIIEAIQAAQSSDEMTADDKSAYEKAQAAWDELLCVGPVPAWYDKWYEDDDDIAIDGEDSDEETEEEDDE